MDEVQINSIAKNIVIQQYNIEQLITLTFPIQNKIK